jgi:hypothetical protein
MSIRRIALPFLWLLIPMFLWLGGIAAEWAFDYFHCAGHIQSGHIRPCVVAHVDVAKIQGIGWWCRLLWFPAFLVCTIQVGLSAQKLMQEQGLAGPRFTYRDALQASPKAFILLSAITAIGVAGVLVLGYPKRPSSLMEWALVAAPWAPAWLTLNWLRERTSHGNF